GRASGGEDGDLLGPAIARGLVRLLRGRSAPEDCRGGPDPREYVAHQGPARRPGGGPDVSPAARTKLFCEPSAPHPAQRPDLRPLNPRKATCFPRRCAPRECRFDLGLLILKPRGISV